MRKRLRRAGENAFSEFTFSYRGEVLEVVEVFPYLGCETHHTAGLQFAYASRDKKAGRQWGALRSALRSAPHLPASRAFVLAESLGSRSPVQSAGAEPRKGAHVGDAPGQGDGGVGSEDPSKLARPRP